MRRLIGLIVLMGCFAGCSDNDHERIREEMDQIADQEDELSRDFEAE